MIHCQRIDCFYRAERHAGNGCDYISKTGRSRIKGLPPELQDPGFCTHYIRGHREGHAPFPSDYKPRTDSSQARTYGKYAFDWDKALILEAEGASRREIALAIGCTVAAVKAWRKRRKEGRQ